MVHRIDNPVRRVRRPVRELTDAAAVSTEPTAPARPVVLATAALIGASVVLMTLAFTGVADILPIWVRTAVVALVALTLPGLPVAALLRLPRNGIFASVTIAVSLAVNIVLAHLNIVAELRHPYLVQIVVLVAAAGAALLIRTAGDEPRRAPLTADGLAEALARRALPLVILSAAVALFASAVWRLEPGAAGSAGLISILGVEYFAGLALLALVLAIEYRRVVFDKVAIAAANVVLMIYVTMPVAWATGVAPFPTAFAHRYITNWIATIEAVPPAVDARMSWAGFFSTGAHLMAMAGLTDSAPFLMNASLVFSILMVFPVYAIGMAIGGNPRGAWLGVTVYVLFNWYQQDYFAPQAVAMQFYATILAVLMWQLRNAPQPELTGSPLAKVWAARSRIPGRVPGRSARWTWAMEAVLVLVVTAMVISHQLTPLMAILALTLFAVMGLTRYKMLWAAAVLVFVAWFEFGAYGYWEGHLVDTLSDVGGVDTNLTSGVASRITADPVYGRMQYLRMAASLLLFATALLGWYRVRHNKLGPIAGVLVVAPLGLVLVQSYGGEVVIRSFLYASPVMAPLAAAVVLPSLLRIAGAHRRRPRAANGPAFLAFLGLGLLVVTNRGLNTSFEQTPQEVFDISRQVDQAVDNAKIAYWGQHLGFRLPKGFDVPEECHASPQELADCTAAVDINYIVETTSDDKYLQYRYGFSPADVDRLVEIMVRDKGFVVIYQGESVRVLRRGNAPDLHLQWPR